jgi:nitrite reductase/ring-hydroxylating ferredoxin subunit
MNPDLLKYFADNWQPDYTKFKYSGWALLDKIKEDDQILDIGCGYNLFKKHFGNRLYGIDPANNKADQVIAWEDYKLHKKFNVFFVLGSINFGDEKYVESQIAKLSRETKTGDRVYWRQNPGTGDHPWKGVEEVQFYPWSFDKNKEWADKYNFTINELLQDTGNRIYTEWTRN